MDSRLRRRARAAGALLAAACAWLIVDRANAEPVLPDLTPDPGFGTLGQVSFAVTSDTAALRISGIGHMVRADGSMLVATSHTVAGAAALSLRQLGRDGSLDGSFGTAGVRLHSLPDCGTAGTPIIAQAAPGDRSIVSIGTCTLRLLADGSIDTSYGADGFVSDPANSFPQFLRADSQGRALNFRRNSAVFAFEVTRLDVNGVLDTSFGVAGSGAGQLVTGSGVWNSWDAFLQVDDKPLMVGFSNAMQGVGRWTLNGQPDTEFGNAGMASVACPTNSSSCDATGGVARADGKIVLPLMASVSGVTRLSAVVIDEHALASSPPQTYVVSELPTLGPDAGGSDIRAVALAGDRSALVFKTRSATAGSTADIVVLCLRGDATLDPRCGASGYRLLDTVINGGTRGNEFPRWVSYHADTLVISAITTSGSQDYATVWRLTFDRVFANGFE